MTQQTFAIVGANLAGGTAASTLREEGFDGRIVLIGAEPHPPYERPPLSKEYLRGQIEIDKAYLHPADFWKENGIDMVLGVRATSVDTGAKRVRLDNGEEVAYDGLLLTTGVRNRRFPIPGLDLEGVHDLRTIENADRIKSEISSGRKAVVVGMGFIGAEVAASLRTSGLEVTAIEPFRVPLARVLGEDIGGTVAAMHHDHGVNLVFEDSVDSFAGSTRVEAVITKSGRRLDCDFAVVGVGVQPNQELAEEAGIKVDNGILVDELCRTSAENVYAAGDVARHHHPMFGDIRVEHWQNAIKHGQAAAKSMLGKGQTYDEVHWFWSDQYEDNVQYAGFHMTWDELVVRGSLKDRNFVAFYISGGVVLATVGFNRGRDVRRSIPLIRSRAQVDSKQLRNEDMDLRTLAR